MQEKKENICINVKAMYRLKMGWGEAMLSLVKDKTLKVYVEIDKAPIKLILMSTVVNELP